jgi:hypothetical protein
MKNRNIVAVLVLFIITLGIYGLYWFIKTRRELVDRGASIPTTILIIIPIANLYYLYMWSMGAAKVLKKENMFGYLLTILMLFISPIGALVAQNEFNSCPE